MTCEASLNGHHDFGADETYDPKCILCGKSFQAVVKEDMKK